MTRTIVFIELRKGTTGEVKKYPVKATMLHGWAVHQSCTGWGVGDTPEMGGLWTISAPNGRALGSFVTQKQALQCIREIREIATVTQLVAIPTDKENRTPEQHTLARRVMDIVNTYRPTEEGDL